MGASSLRLHLWQTRVWGWVAVSETHFKLISSSTAPDEFVEEKTRHGNQDKEWLCFHINYTICFIEKALKINV